MVIDLSENVALARYSALHVGGSARHFARVSTLLDLRSALLMAEDRGLPFFILGGGTNFFCRERGFAGLVIKMENRALAFDHQELTADAGVVTRIAVLKAVERGLRGMERLAGIPGTIGGAVRGNAGAFGMETADRLLRVSVLRKTGSGWEEDMLPKSRLSFGYRDSPFKREPKTIVVWNATFGLTAGDRSAGERLVFEDLEARKAKQPYEFPSVGSVFKNPSKEQPAGKLIESLGMKGFRLGDAEISAKHANFIVNRGHATAADVLALMTEVKKRVFDTHGIRLEEEIVVL